MYSTKVDHHNNHSKTKDTEIYQNFYTDFHYTLIIESLVNHSEYDMKFILGL